MKSKDIALLIFVAGFSVIVSIITGNLLFGTSTSKGTSVPTVDAISTDFPSANKNYFNSNSIDPAVTIQVNPNSNKAPFNSSSATGAIN